MKWVKEQVSDHCTGCIFIDIKNGSSGSCFIGVERDCTLNNIIAIAEKGDDPEGIYVASRTKDRLGIPRE